MSLSRKILLALSRSARLGALAGDLRPARAVARRFVAGDTLPEAIAAVLALNQQGLRATLDHLGENVSTDSEARSAAAEILDLVDGIHASGVQSGVSVKLSQLGLGVSRALAAENLESVIARARQAGRFVRIDMEDHSYVQATLDLFLEMWERYRNVGVVIQAYLYRSEEDIALLIGLGASVRLVKGAYDEPADVAYRTKADTDANYRRLAAMLLSAEAQRGGVFPSFATHDHRLIAWVQQYARQHGIAPNGFEFQMLYGIRPALQLQLVADGYRVRVYVPYGKRWYPYFMRRLAERPANLRLLLHALLRA